jgi:hypothetical protein
MDQPSQSKNLAKKIWYGTAITVSVLVLLFSAVGVIGTWVVQSKLSATTVALLQAAENVAGRARDVIVQVKDPLLETQQISNTVAETSAKLSQNVKDEGLLKLLLPADQEQNLVNLALKVQDTLSTVHEVLSSAVDMYQAINQIPFVKLPTPDLEKVRSVEQTVSDIRISIEELRARVIEFRAGAADKIGVVTDIATRISTRMGEVLDNLNALDAELAGYQQTLAGLRSAVPTAFVISALIITLLLVYVSYTQVEMISLFVGRWRTLGTAALPQAVSTAAESANPPSEAPAPPSEDQPASEEPGEDVTKD